MGDSEVALVKAVDMAKKYGDFIALHPLNVEVHSGEFFGVFGPNGAGKSTFIKLLTGQLKPSKGLIEILGINAVKDPQKLKANIGIVLNISSDSKIHMNHEVGVNRKVHFSRGRLSLEEESPLLHVNVYGPTNV